MSLGIADIDRWDPQTARDAAAAATSRADAAADAARRLVTLPAYPEWEGLAGQAAWASMITAVAELQEHAAEARAVARAAEHAAEAIATIKADLRALDDAAQAGFLEIDHTNGAVRRCPGFRGTAAEFDTAAALVAGRLAGIIAAANAVDAALAQAITAAAQLPTPAPTGPPPQVDVQGLSATERDRANRAALNEDIRRITDAADRQQVSPDEVLEIPELYGLTQSDALRFANALKVADGLELAAMRTGKPILLWSYRPDDFDGQGGAALSIGDPDTAADTTIVVPGTGHSVRDGWLGDADAANLFNEMSLAEPGATHAVIAWMGFNAPDSLADPRVAQPGLARRGAALLAADVKALRAAHLGTPSHITVAGHSYGATTVADAAAGFGMPADDVVLVGCPGTDLARSAADLRLPVGGHLYVGSASTDPVTGLGGINPVAPLPGSVQFGLGADPAVDGFGSTRFKAEVPGWTWKLWTEHSGYYADGSESLYAMADVSTGQGELLEQHDMTAAQRGAGLGGVLGRLSTPLGLPDWLSPFADPELLRPGTFGHHH